MSLPSVRCAKCSAFTSYQSVMCQASPPHAQLLQVQVALDLAQDVIVDDLAVAQLQQLAALRLDRREHQRLVVVAILIVIVAVGTVTVPAAGALGGAVVLAVEAVDAVVVEVTQVANEVLVDALARARRQ